MKVILLLAGKGVRFLPLTERLPKPLIRVAGASVLEHILRSIARLEVSEIILITSHLSAQIEAFMAQHYRGVYRIIRQDKLDGTGGAVYAARDHIDGPVLVLFGDTIFEADLSCLKERPHENVIWTRHVEDFQRFGIVQTGEAGNMAVIVEKPPVDVGRNANIGLYYLADHQALWSALERVMKGASINGEYYFTYALNHMVKNGHSIRVANVNAWHDCGTLSALIETNQQLLLQETKSQTLQFEGVTVVPPVWIEEGAILRDCQIGPNVTIEAGCNIVSSKIKHSLVGRNCVLRNVELTQSLVGPGESLSDVIVERSIVAHGEVKQPR